MVDVRFYFSSLVDKIGEKIFSVLLEFWNVFNKTSFRNIACFNSFLKVCSGVKRDVEQQSPAKSLLECLGMHLFMETNTNTYVNIRQYISYKNWILPTAVDGQVLASTDIEAIQSCGS